MRPSENQTPALSNRNCRHRKGEKVVFASHLLGNLDVCVATIPRAWQETVSANYDGLRTKRR